MNPDLSHPSVLMVRASIPEAAFTAGPLGTRREGSGVVIGENGLVLTVAYLVTEASEVWLTGAGGRVVPAHVLGIDQETGFGLLQALGRLDLPVADLGVSAEAAVGSSTLLADGLGRAVEGSIVARQEFAGYWEYLLDDALFTAPAHPSWGGAGLFDADRRLIGIGSLRLQMRNRGETSDINMAVPIDLLSPILTDLSTIGRASRAPRPWLGVFLAETDGRVVVMNVAEGGPAEEAGLRPGDILSDIRDGHVEGLADFYRKLWQTGPAGAEVPIRIVRDGRDAWLRIRSADRNAFLLKPQLQ